MNKSQMLQYLHECLDGDRRLSAGEGLVDLAHALSCRMLATRGLEANLGSADRVALEREWGQPDLADAVIRTLAAIKRHPPDAGTFVDQSIRASLLVGRDPTGEDAEQAAKVRLLAAASIAFELAKKHSVANLGVDRFVAEIAGGQSLPVDAETSEPLQSWLERTIRYLTRYNPHAYEKSEELHWPKNVVLSSNWGTRYFAGLASFWRAPTLPG